MKEVITVTMSAWQKLLNCLFRQLLQDKALVVRAVTTLICIVFGKVESITILIVTSPIESKKLPILAYRRASTGAGVSQAQSTRMQIFLNPQLFLSGYDFRPDA